MELFILMTCDEWKSWTSMRLRGVFTLQELKNYIKTHSKNTNIKMEEPNQEKDFEFEADWGQMELMSAYEINQYLTYGYVEAVELNSPQ
ncbi:hypothetical protein ACH0BF_19685 [Pseudobacillus sp. 179-B 2D1 NHS]|uniref:hypothetical protein n=1 Tax=Pseudobacillus sp. 179-B 2D1 NHS TaxID=3374292 RepID=UPI003879AD94